MEAHLHVVKGKASKAEIALNLPMVIGRGREAGLTIAHPMVSRRHCELFESDGLLMVRDLGSLNGTVVDGRPVKQSPLAPDAELTVGPLTFRARYSNEGDRDNLPAAEFAELTEPRPVDDRQEAEELPDFQTIEAPAKKPARSKPSGPVSPDEAFDNILEDLD